MRWTKYSLLFALFAMNVLGTAGRSEDVTVEENITYGNGGETELKLDLARPTGDGPCPAIVFIHGGGWYQGNRQAYEEETREAAERGCVAATISCGLMQFDEAKKETTTAEPGFPAQVRDAKTATRGLRANGEKYNVDPERIGETGGSAGGHLSLLIGATMLHKKMKEAGANHTLMVLEGQGHGFGGEHQQRAMKAMWDFFDQHLKS